MNNDYWETIQIHSGLSMACHCFDHVMEGGASAIGNAFWGVHYAREEHLSGGAGL